VQVHKVQHEETSRRDDKSAEPVDEEELQQADARPRLGSHHSFKVRTRLTELGKCWICLEKGHRSFECEKKGQPGYPLKAAKDNLKA